MKISKKIIVFFFIPIFFIGKINAQVQCKTYTCFLCEWGGEFKVVAPTIFTPNKDEINDLWIPQVFNEACLSDFTITIFNRWGTLVFESTVYSVGWNGNTVSGGNPYPEGTYYYKLSYTNGNTKETKNDKGFFQLAR
jgi:gliding motility-associated-like protein